MIACRLAGSLQLPAPEVGEKLAGRWPRERLARLADKTPHKPSDPTGKGRAGSGKVLPSLPVRRAITAPAAPSPEIGAFHLASGSGVGKLTCNTDWGR